MSFDLRQGKINLNLINVRKSSVTKIVLEFFLFDDFALKLVGTEASLIFLRLRVVFSDPNSQFLIHLPPLVSKTSKMAPANIFKIALNQSISFDN